jgi:hypothetical protein
LDRFIFAAMKARSRRADRTDAVALESTNKLIAAPFLIRAWETVNAAVVNDTWARYWKQEEDHHSINELVRKKIEERSAIPRRNREGTYSGITSILESLNFFGIAR